ncbi:MAG: hypothetical protein ACFFER_17915 [Candidatus Thorarchaeota archaeon]
MDKSHKLIYFSILSLVFVTYYFFTGSRNAVQDTIKSIILVGIASIFTWAAIREQKKRGKLQS